MVLGALIGAGASLLGKVFGASSKPQVTTNRVDYKRMVKDAEAAGFNPLTALRNGGAAGFSISSTPSPPLSARLADGVASGVNTFLANFDPHQDRMREAEFGLIQAQINNLNASAAAASRVPDIGGVPTRQAARVVHAAPVVSSRHGAGINGEVLPIWTDWRDRDGSIIQLPNPDLPESEQFMVPGLGIGAETIHQMGERFPGLPRGRAHEPSVGDAVRAITGWLPDEWNPNSIRNRAYRRNRD